MDSADGSEPDLPGRPVLGRDVEWQQLAAVVPPSAAGPHVVLVLGEAGIGKTTLLSAATARARTIGVRVLIVRCSETERGLAFAGLHQLVRPLMNRAADLPDRQRLALLGAFGLEGGASEPDGLFLRLAALTLLSDLADQGPVLITIDDAHWLDAASRDVLTFIARRLEGEPIAVLISVRGSEPITGLDGEVSTVRLSPLAGPDAARLLDLQPGAPVGETRDRLLALAAGNPLALVELARTASQDGLGTGAIAVPISTRLERAFASSWQTLPEATRWMLLVAASADTTESSLVLSAAGAVHSDDLWLPAAQAGLARLHRGRIEFSHPLVRSAIYQAAPIDLRRRAHRALADGAERDPDRRAWHLAAVTTGPDEDVAAALEATADRLQTRGAVLEALASLERAAELSPDPHARGTRLARAAVTAMMTGHAVKAGELADSAAAFTNDPTAAGYLAVLAGQAASTTLRFGHALEVVLAASAASDTEVALYALAIASHITYCSGREEDRARVVRAFADATATGPSVEPFRLWLTASLDPIGGRAAAAHGLAALTATEITSPADLSVLGVLALLLDETEIAQRLLSPIAESSRQPGGWESASGDAMTEHAWAQFAAGHWTDADQGIDELLRSATSAEPTYAIAKAMALRAVLSAVRGNTDAARTLATDVFAITEPRAALSIATTARWAMGLADVADGEHETAYTRFRELFDADGNPIHPHQPYYALADLAAAAARTGRSHDARPIVGQSVSRLIGSASPRLQMIARRAEAHITEDEPEAAFAAALEDPSGERWPFERAQTRLAYGEYLRRARRIVAARQELQASLATFDRLGARPWVHRAHSELRATGVNVAPARGDALAELTPQQQQIVRLAAQGLTNRDIGERLFLSRRTIAFHLYQVFPKLGITSRTQLRDLLTTEQDHD